MPKQMTVKQAIAILEKSLVRQVHWIERHNGSGSAVRRGTAMNPEQRDKGLRALLEELSDVGDYKDTHTLPENRNPYKTGFGDGVQWVKKKLESLLSATEEGKGQQGTVLASRCMKHRHVHPLNTVCDDGAECPICVLGEIRDALISDHATCGGDYEEAIEYANRFVSPARAGSEGGIK